MLQATLLKQEGQKSIVVSVIRNRVINYNKNFMASILGETGSGKSYTALRLAELINPERFNVSFVVFSTKDFMKLLNSKDLKKGDVIVYDEAGVGQNAREWYSQANKIFNYVAQTFRNLNLVVFFTTPHTSFIDSATRKLLHAQFQTCGINMKEKTCLMKAYLLQTNPSIDKTYFHKFKQYDRASGEVLKISKMKVNLPSKELRKQYEIKKTEFTTALNRDALKGMRSLPKELIEGKELSPYEINLKNDYLDKGMTTKQLAERYDRAESTIRKWLEKISMKVGYDVHATKKIRIKTLDKLKYKAQRKYNNEGFDFPEKKKVIKRRRDPLN